MLRPYPYRGSAGTFLAALFILWIIRRPVRLLWVAFFAVAILAWLHSPTGAPPPHFHS